VNSLSEYDAVIQDAVQGSASGHLWFRGWTGAEDVGLLPTLFRHPAIQDPAEVRELEGRLVARFRQRSLPYQPAVFDPLVPDPASRRLQR
jgi:hypothetical protein